jgi:hypothetical protein
MKNLFLTKYPTAVITEKKAINGDIIILINGQTAYNKEDRFNASNWFLMMENALKRSMA